MLLLNLMLFTEWFLFVTQCVVTFLSQILKCELSAQMCSLWFEKCSKRGCRKCIYIYLIYFKQVFSTCILLASSFSWMWIMQEIVLVIMFLETVAISLFWDLLKFKLISSVFGDIFLQCLRRICAFIWYG